MKKLYLATINFNTIFVSTEADQKSGAKRYAEEEFSWNGLKETLKRVEVKEIACVQEIPQEWSDGALIWGTEEEITAANWLDQNQPKQSDSEFQEYLRLKAKYE